MKTTLYWDVDRQTVWYKNKDGIWRVGHKMCWTDSCEQYWVSSNFDKSLTVNNFKEK